VVALGEGLETQFWRLDNGRMQWVTVDLPETLKLRQQTAARWSQATQPRRICAGQRLAGPAGPAQPVLVTAQGLLPYFRREQVHELIAAIARRLPSGSLVFDVVPERMLQMLRRLPDRESAQANRLWSWVFNTEDREAISAIPGVTSVHDLTPPLPLGVAPLVLAGVRRLPRRMRYALPVGPVLEVTFR
jgi:O-methyltransferase involved in polyketide biosynthesis